MLCNSLDLRLWQFAPVIPDGKKFVSRWLKLPLRTRLELRNIHHGDVLTEACVKLWPGDPTKHLSARDLRHCYAIHLLNKGVSLSLVAQALGDSVVVAQTYYAGFTLGDQGLQVVNNLLSS